MYFKYFSSSILFLFSSKKNIALVFEIRFQNVFYFEYYIYIRTGEGVVCFVTQLLFNWVQFRCLIPKYELVFLNWCLFNVEYITLKLPKSFWRHKTITTSMKTYIFARIYPSVYLRSTFLFLYLHVPISF